MDGSVPDKDIFVELDHAPVPDGWWPDLSDTLLRLGASIVPIDRPILAPLVAYLARHSRGLRVHAGKMAPVEPPKEIHDSHPGSATLFRYRHGRSAGLERLTSIGLCALLEASEDGRGPPKRLLSMVRGALDTPNSPLSGALGAISSIPELVRIVDTDEPTRRTLPQNFLQLWESWLRDTLIRWMLAEPGRLRQALELRVLGPQLEDPLIPVSMEPGQVEGGTDLSCSNTPPSGSGPEETASSRLGRAVSDQLERASAGDLMAPAEYRFPKVLDERLCRDAVARAKQYLDQDRALAESFGALALLLAGGIREIDLRDVVWGGDSAARPHAIDPDVPVLYRRLRRPANAVLPAKHLDEWLEPSTDVMAWPLPDSIHALLVKLADGVATPGQAVLPMLAASPASPYRMHDVIAQLVPEAKVGALAPRLMLASEIAAALGMEMAQLAMADTFGMSSIPAYYSSIPEAGLAEFIAGVQSRRFGERVPVPAGRYGHVGSRLVLTDAAAKRWPEMLRDALKSASRQSGGWLAEWWAHRNHLAAALCSATGHRPEDALGRIFLGDVIPEYGLIILQDKQVDALRATRIAATGRLWLSDLRRYLDRLIEIATQQGEKPEGRLAALILRNEEPLFSVPGPDGSAAPMTAAALRDGMPPELQSVDNFFRHRLNQRLLACGVDPELRHAQLGWVVSPAHLHSDLSPRAPIDMGLTLGAVIDDLLVTEGWYLPSARKTRWTWAGVPMPSPVDWDAVFASQKRQHEEELKRIRLRLRERWKEYEGAVMSRLADAFREFCPTLNVDVEKKCLTRIAGVETAVKLEGDHHALICDRVRQGDQEPSSGLEAVMARILLYRLVRRARDKGLIQGPIPGRPYLSVTADPSPFVPGLGTAVRQARAIRQALEARASTGHVRDQGQLTVWSILAFSMYRRMPWAQSATGAARTAMRAKGRSHVIRIAARVEGAGMHMVFSGVPATLLARRKRHAPTAVAPTLDALEDWAITHLSDEIEWGARGAAAGRIETTLAAAARIELSGIERWLFQAGPQTAAESPIRCVARDDGWPVHTADDVPKGKDASVSAPPIVGEDATKTEQVRRSDYARLIGLLNRRKFGRNRAAKAAKKQASDGNHGWRRALRAELERLREDVGSDSNLGVLIGYVLDHLRYGSEDGNPLSQNSLRREISQIGWPLLVLLADRSLLGLTAEELRRLYREILLSKSAQARPYAFEEIQRLHRFLMRVHARPSVDMAELAALAGSRQLGIEPGLLTQAELCATAEELQRDHENEVERLDASPDFLRLAQLRRTFFLILEASGIRPGSAYGLTLADIHLFGEAGDFVHVRTGNYGEAKTSTSLGFVPLASALWEQNRQWVVNWLEEQRRLHPGAWQELPLFAAKAGGRTRVHEHHLTGRINALLKWASGSREAHCYWLRKVRISERFHALACKEEISARGVYGTMVMSGHAWIQVTIERYVNDPASLLFVDLRTGCEASRAVLLAMSGLEEGPLDVAWNRAGRDGPTRIRVLLDRVEAGIAEVPSEHRTPPPALRRFKPLQPVHVDAYARGMRRHRSQAEAALDAGITIQQAIQLDKAASELFVRLGYAPWKIPEQGSSRYILPVPRNIAGSDKWFDLLEEEPAEELKRIAESWAGQPHIERLHGEDAVMRIEAAHLPVICDLLVKTGLKMQVVTSNGHHLLMDNQRAKYRKGHGAALRWVLSLVWIYMHAQVHAT